MNKIFNWYNNLSKQVRDSVIISATLIGMISTLLSILGVSLGDWKESSIWLRIGIVLVAFLLLCAITYTVIGKIFSKLVKLTIRKTTVSIECGDIFDVSGLRVIGCDTHFDTRVDDIIIAKRSLHGQLVLEHGDKGEIVLFLSSNTKSSQALREEIDYGINTKGLPVIVIYPDFKEKTDIWCSTGMQKQVTDLWDKLPKFRDNMDKVATLHVPYKKMLITSALKDADFKVQTMTKAGSYHYKLD